MTSRECFENKWFYMKYLGKFLSGEILLTHECILTLASVYALIKKNTSYVNVSLICIQGMSDLSRRCHTLIAFKRKKQYFVSVTLSTL